MEFLNVIAAALGAFAFGAVWYMAMSGPWIRASGVPVDVAGKPKGNGSAMPFVVGLVAMLVVAGMMRHIFAASGIATLGAGIVAGMGIGAFFITPWMAMNCIRRLRPIGFRLAGFGDVMKRRAVGSSSGTTRRGPYAPWACGA